MNKDNQKTQKIDHGTLPGPSHIKYMAKGGFPMTRKIVCMPGLSQRKMEKNRASIQLLDQVCIGGAISVVVTQNLHFV